MSAFDYHIDCWGSNNNIGDIVGRLGALGSANNLVNGNQIQLGICRCDNAVVDWGINTNVDVSGRYNCWLGDAAINGY